MSETAKARDGLQRLWGRRQAFPLRDRQAALFESLMPRVRIDLPTDVLPRSIDPRVFFAVPRCEISLEIGFGGGEHLIAWAKAHPDEGFIGAEPFINGMAKCLAHLDDEKLENVRLFAGDARHLLRGIRAASLARVFLLFPDPWPKTRHWKRRFVQDETLCEIARVLVPGGSFRISSDIPHYIEWTLEHALRRPEFSAEHSEGGWLQRPQDWPPTRYEAKALREGRSPVFLEFRSKPA